MKKSITVSALVFIMLLFSAQSSFAQFHMKIGPLTGMNFNIHTGSDIESGTGFGFLFGGQVDMNFSPIIGLVTNLQFYDNMSGSTNQTSSQTYQLQGGGTISSTISTDNSVSLAYFMIEPLLKLNLPASGFYFLVGPSFGFNIQGSGETTTTETLPQGYTFQDGSNSVTNKSKGSIKNLNARFAFSLGGGYDFRVSPLIIITPQVSFAYGLTTVEQDVSWRVLNIQAAAVVKFSLL